MASYILLALMHTIFATKLIKTNYSEIKSYLDLKFLIVISFFVIAISPISILLFSHLILRLCAVFFIVFLIIIRRNGIIQILKNGRRSNI